MKKYGLHLLDKLIGDKYGHDPEEVGILFAHIKETAFNLPGVEETKLYIGNNQKSLLEQREFEAFGETCDKVLYYIETYFSDYTNNGLQLSDFGRKKLTDRYSTLIEKTKKEVEQCLNKKLFEAMSPLLEMDGPSGFTVHHGKYLDQFWHNWAQRMKHTEGSIKEADVVKFLVVNNFNSEDFFIYLTDQVISEMVNEDSPLVCEEILSSHAKGFKRIATMIGLPFTTKFPHIKELLDEWFKTEMKNCRVRQKNEDPRQLSIIGQGDGKMESPLSVAQLAYFYKMMKNSGLMGNGSHQDVLKFIVRNYSTQKVETIAIESIHNKYYNVEGRTKDVVGELFEKLARDVKSDN